MNEDKTPAIQLGTHGEDYFTAVKGNPLLLDEETGQFSPVTAEELMQWADAKLLDLYPSRNAHIKRLQVEGHAIMAYLGFEDEEDDQQDNTGKSNAKLLLQICREKLLRAKEKQSAAEDVVETLRSTASDLSSYGTAADYEAVEATDRLADLSGALEELESCLEQLSKEITLTAA
jgi:hypothetical protein